MVLINVHNVMQFKWVAFLICLSISQLKGENYIVTLSITRKVCNFVTCFIASSLWQVGRTTAAIQPRQGVY